VRASAGPANRGTVRVTMLVRLAWATLASACAVLRGCTGDDGPTSAPGEAGGANAPIETRDGAARPDARGAGVANVNATLGEDAGGAHDRDATGKSATDAATPMPPAPAGAFVQDVAFPPLPAGGTVGWGPTLIPIDHDGDGRLDVVRSVSGIVDVVLRRGDGWEVGAVLSGTGTQELCLTAADVVGDAALDLLCFQQGDLVAVHGQLVEGGRTAVTEQSTLIAAGLESSGGRIAHVLVFDIDDDGCSEIGLSTYEQGVADVILWCTPEAGAPGWEPVTSDHVGQTFAIAPWRRDGERGLLFMTESGRYEAGFNENQVLIWRGARSFEALYTTADSACDWYGYLRPPSGPVKGTPMGYARWYPRWDAPELFVLTQHVGQFPLFEDVSGQWCNVGGEREFDLPADPMAPPFHWAAVTIPNPTLGTGELLVVAAEQVGAVELEADGSGNNYAGLHAYDWPVDAHPPRELGRHLGMPDGSFVTLSRAPIDDGCSPDLIAASFDGKNIMLTNEVRSDGSGDHLCFSVLGPGGESAEVVVAGRRAFAVDQEAPWSATLPYVFEYVSAAPTISVEIRWSGSSSFVTFDVPPGRLVHLLPDGQMLTP
jgi:hypothetical protein